jgi:hypothetical protein
MTPETKALLERIKYLECSSWGETAEIAKDAAAEIERLQKVVDQMRLIGDFRIGEVWGLERIACSQDQISPDHYPELYAELELRKVSGE